MLTSDSTPSFSLPMGISERDAPLDVLRLMTKLELFIPDDYEAVSFTQEIGSEVFAIQRLLTIAKLGIPISIRWGPNIGKRLEKVARLEPLLAVTLMLQGAEHKCSGLDAHQIEQTLLSARLGIQKNRITSDLFSPSQMLLCADSRGIGRPEQLYLAKGGALRPRSHFETLVQEVLETELKSTGDTAKRFKWASSLGVIVAELFENTDIHAMTDLKGARFSTNAMRGLIFKRIRLTVPLRDANHRFKDVDKECLEISIFDTGLGYFRSFTRSDEDLGIEFEWRVLHKCLERHFDKDIADPRPAHRGLGLNEVLRALQTLAGRIEIRTGRTFGYRTFIEGQLQAQMQPPIDELSNFSWPRPRLLDTTKKVVAIPTPHEYVVGCAIRVVIPLN